MELKEIDIIEELSPELFRKEYFQKKPVVIKNLSSAWPALSKWDWDYLRNAAPDEKVGIYSNARNKENTPVNTAHDFTTFGEYIDRIKEGDAQWRIFLFNLLEHAPQLMDDFNWPDNYFTDVVKRFPMLFAGGKGSITHLHFDMDLSDVMQTQFLGKKRVLIFPFDEQEHLYRRPFEVMSLVDFSDYYKSSFKEKVERYPALKMAKGYETILDHGDTIYIPSKFWHHMEYLESGVGLSLRSWQHSIGGKINGLYHILVMRNIDAIMKRTIPQQWYNYKLKRIGKTEEKLLRGSA